jgi:hypothetical protein
VFLSGRSLRGVITAPASILDVYGLLRGERVLLVLESLIGLLVYFGRVGKSREARKGEKASVEGILERRRGTWRVAKANNWQGCSPLNLSRGQVGVDCAFLRHHLHLLHLHLAIFEVI